MPRKPLPQPPDEAPAGCLAPMVYLVLLTSGLLIYFYFFHTPLRRVLAARDWTPVRATVVQSFPYEAPLKEEKYPKPTSQPVSTGTGVWRAMVRYRYEYNGQDYRQDNVWFVPERLSLVDARSTVERYPKGREFTAYVNPADPKFAVLERGFRPRLLVAIVPALMALVGLLGLLSRVVRFARPEQPEEDAPRVTYATGPRRTPRPESLGKPGAVTFHGKAGVGGLIFMVIFACVWNGIISVLVWQVVEEWRGKNVSCYTIGFTLFAIPFVLVGLFTVLASVYQFLKLFNPRPVLTVSSATPSLGSTLDVSWHFTGRSDRIHWLKVQVEGREEATYTRGTSTYTDKEVFRTLVLVDTKEPAEIPAGHASVELPNDSVPTFEAARNKIIWTVRVVGAIRRWPDVDEQFEVTVLPLPVRDAAPATPGSMDEGI